MHQPFRHQRQSRRQQQHQQKNQNAKHVVLVPKRRKFATYGEYFYRSQNANDDIFKPIL